ncbi:MAG: hypothetical protein J6S84_01470, partial [Bacteroidales bacterium]|nr:hypothetical protein [Bacteroidales bacterium]
MDNIQKLFYVVALCAALLFFSAVASFGQNVIYSCDFEDNTENANWTLENGSHINQWYIGTAARNGGDNGLYITNDGGANNAYDNTATSYVYAYRTLNVDEDGYYTVSFDWQANGEGSYDYLRAFIVPASANPDLSAGTAIEGSTTVPDGWIDIANGELSMGGYEWHNSNNIVALDATTYHLVFYWKNSNSGNGYQPPAAVDNISITKVSCVAVTSITATDITGESATISWTERGSAENWEIVVSVTELDVTALENNENIVSVTSPSYSATSLTKRTTYYVYVRAVCSTDDKSDWQSATFSSAGLLTLYPDSRTSTSLNMKAKMFSIAASGRSITFSSGRVGGIINSYSNSASINGNILLNQKDGLSPETEYYYTVSASNAFGSYTSDTIRVTTCGTMTDERDGTQYNTIKIGEQVWMAENLRYEGSIPLSTSTNSTYSSTDPYRYYPTGGEEKVQAYGYLYNLPAAMNGASGSNANPSGVQGICPEGWHLPSKAEWDELENHLNSENAGAMLAGKYRLWGDDALTQSYYFGASGFDALPAGYVTEGNNYNGGNYENADGAYFWSSNVLNGGESAICTNVYSYAVYFRNNGSGQTASTGNSVRCVKSLSPTVATNWATGITTSSATLNAHINNLGDATVSVRGFMFGTDMDELTQNLTSSDNTTDFTYTIEDLSPSTIYYFKAYITIGAETIYGEIITFNTLAGLLAGHGYVDLGLPSGTYWATCNVGATTIEGLGNYYAWGETSPKPRYTSDNYTYDAYSDILPLSDDAAAVNWGDGWRMPTDEEMVELYDNCDYTFTIWNDTVRGLLLTSRINGNTIFLPAAGNGFEDYTTASQYECELFYWTSSIADYPQAYSLYYYRPYDNLSAETTFNRYQGLSVRAVFKDIPTVETKSATDVTPTTATLHGKILFTENATVTNRGFSFGTDSDDLTQDFTSTDNTDNFTYSLTDLTANTTYYFQAYATIDGDIMYGEIKSFTTPRETHDFVDLGLPSGNKWATCNVGASVPEGFGNYYGWGETYNKEIGDWPTYIYYNGSSFTKYTRSDGRTTLEAMDDAATVNWGDGWRMPTKDEVSELFNNCSSIWTTLNGVNGRLFTSNLNGNTIFLPAAGKVNEGGYENDGRSGTYWSSSFRTTSTNEGAWDYEVYPDVCELGSLGYRKYGRSVRAIYTLAPTVVTNNATYLTSTSATLNASITDNGNSAIIERGFKYGTDRNNLNEIVQSNDATSDFSVSLTGLAEGTLYYYCAYATNSDATDYAGIKSFMTPQNPATLPYTCGFEDATENDNWVLENGNQTNNWYIGTVVNNGGENGLYISNDGGISNTYSGTETRVYAYRDILVPDGTTDLLLSFDWKAKGGLRNYEFLRVYWLNPAVVTVTAGNNPPTINGVNYDLAGQPGSYGSFANSHWLSQQNTWQHEVMIISADQFTDMGNGDKIYRLYFHWRNINYSSQPPAAVDNVHLEQIINPIVATSSVSDISTTSATLHGSILSHGASDITVRGFEYGTDEENLTEIVQSTDGTNDFSVSLTNLASNTTYYYRAYATNSDDTGYGEIKMFTTNGIINDHEFVDLGLPSGTKWATCNVGASNPEDYGDYFAWGETTPKDTYTWETYIYAEGTSNNNPELTKYNNNAQYGNNGFTDNLTTLESTDDAATANWGAGWRMPTETEMRELIENCDITWTSTSGAGMVFTSRSNGNSIFLPAAGTYGVNGLRDLGSYGTYWPSSLYTNAPSDSWRFIFYSQNHLMDNDYRYEGLSVRAIYRLSPTVATNSADNITHTTATLHGSISNIGASEIIERGFEYGTDRENLTETVQCTDATNAFSVSLTNLASGTIYYYRAYATNSDDTGYGEILTFNTKICPDENMCGISYELADSYGDGWNGCAI